MAHRWPLETQDCSLQVAIRGSRLWSTGGHQRLKIVAHRWPLETQDCSPQVAIRGSRLWPTGGQLKFKIVVHRPLEAQGGGGGGLSFFLHMKAPCLSKKKKYQEYQTPQKNI